MDFFQNSFHQLYKKIYIIIFFSVVCCFGLGLEKYYFGNFVVRTGNIYVTDIVRVEQIKPNNVDVLKAGDLLKTTGNIYSFIKKNETEGPIDFNKLNANWSKLDKDSKIHWVDDNLKINDFGHDTYEIIIELDSFTPKDVQYLDKNADMIINEFVSSSSEFIKKVEPSASIRVVDQESVLPEPVVISRKQTVIKYGIIGFILGAVVSSVVILIRALGKKNDI